jgi:hypothetical protein
MGGWLQFERGEVGWERRRARRRRNRGKECQRSGYIMAFTDGITNEYIMLVIPSVILTVKVRCNWTAISV